MDLALLLGLLIGLISVALGIFFGLSGFRNRVSDKLSSIEKHTEPIGDIKDKISGMGERVIAIQGTTEKAWDLLSAQLGKGGTVERNLENLGKVRITAEPGAKETSYLIEIEKPILKEGLLIKLFQEPLLVKLETQLLGKEGRFTILSSTRMRYYLPSTDPKACTDFISFVLKELNSTYIESLKGIKEFEEPVLS